MSTAELLKDADYWIRKCWNPQFGIDIENMQPLSEENIYSINKNIEILKNMIDFCIEKSLKPVICYLPVTNYLGNKFSDEFINSNIKSYVLKSIYGKDIQVIDMMKDERFIDKDFYFNSFFMNNRGAKIFTRQLLENIIAKYKE